MVDGDGSCSQDSEDALKWCGAHAAVHVIARALVAAVRWAVHMLKG